MLKSHLIFLQKVLKYQNKQNPQNPNQWMIEIVVAYLTIQIIFRLIVS